MERRAAYNAHRYLYALNARHDLTRPFRHDAG